MAIAPPGTCRDRARLSCGGRRLRPPNAPPGPASPDHAYYRRVAARKDGKRPTLAVERKVLRRCYHTLRELGDAALAPPDPIPVGQAA